jgi:hypothetical protein
VKSTIISYARSNKIFKNEFILSLKPLSSDFQLVTLTKLSRKTRIIYLYSLNREWLETFSSATQAAKAFNISHPIILRHARSGKRISLFFFFFFLF